MIEISVKGNMANIIGQDNVITSGSVNYDKVKFTITGDGWTGLTKKAVIYKTLENPYTSALDSEDVATIPWECLTTPGRIHIGLYGEKVTEEEIETRLPTNILDLVVIDGAYKEGQTPTPPTPTETQLIILRFAEYDTSIKASADAAKISEDNAEEYKTSAELSAVSAKNSEDIATAKADIATAQAVISGAQAVIAATKAEISTDKANGASINKDATDQNKTLTEGYKAIAEVKAAESTEQALLSEYYASLAQSIASSIPMRYYRATEEQMESISNPVQGSLCYVTDFVTGKSQLFVYDTTDIDEDEINPEWVFLGNLEFANLDRNTLLGILSLATVATSGLYSDLAGKPNRYESIATVSNGIWDYALADKILLITANLGSIVNVTNGAIGLVITEFEIDVPINSKKSIDYDYVSANAGEHYQYTFVYDGSFYYWSRTVMR